MTSIHDPQWRQQGESSSISIAYSVPRRPHNAIAPHNTSSQSSRSMRDTLNALTSTFAAPTTPYPLPDELQHTIEAFLERYQDIDEQDSQRLHEDLLSLYNRHVAGNADKRGPFLSALRRVRPALTGEARMKEWWGLVVKPTIDTIGHKRHEVEEARGFLQDILAYDADEDKSGEHARISKQFSKILLDAYLSRTKVPTGADDFISPEDEFVSHELETVLVAFGRRKPKVRPIEPISFFR